MIEEPDRTPDTNPAQGTPPIGEDAEQGQTQMRPPRGQGQRAVTESTGGRRVATVAQVAPASADPNTSPDVAPK